MDESSPPPARGSPSSPPLLPQGEKGASRCAQSAPFFPLSEGGPDGRHFDRLRWRCRRGLLELDLILGDFLRQRYAGLSDGERALFDRLLALPDMTLLAYLRDTEIPADPELMCLVRKIQQ